jgi:hypothetical protein
VVLTGCNSGLKPGLYSCDVSNIPATKVKLC